MSPEPRRREFVATFGVVCALLVAPVLIFLRFHGVGLLASELWILAGAGAAIAAAAAFALELAGPAVRAGGIALLAVGFADLQTAASASNALLIASAVAGGAIAWRARAVWRPIVGPIAWTFVAAAALIPSGGADMGFDRVPGPREPSLPPLLHVILDEQIGVEGIPREFDPGADAARSLRDAYTSRGFSVFGRAYSRHFLSRNSFSALFNHGKAGDVRGTARRVELTDNAYFDELIRRGYVLHVRRTDYLDLCAATAGVALEHCSVDVLESPGLLTGSGLPLTTRLELIAGMLTRLSRLLPDRSASRVSALSGMTALDWLQDEATHRLEPGVAVIAHVMLPHFPFAWDADCTLRRDARSWLAGGPDRESADHFSAANRRRSYPAYLAQMACTTKRVGALLDAVDAAPRAAGSWIIVQGDHGSRLTTLRPAPPVADELSATDMADAYSTLFAVRKPGLPANYDARLLPIEALLEAALAPGPVPSGERWQQPPEVVLANRLLQLRVALPAFEREEARPARGGSGL